MARLLATVLTLAVTATCQSPPVKYGEVRAENGQVVIGQRTGGSFGPGSFTVGEPGRSGPGGVGGQGGDIYNVPPQYRDNPHITGLSSGDDGTSIVIDKITGGSYPDGSFAIGRRSFNENARGSNIEDGSYPQEHADEQRPFTLRPGRFSIGHGEDSVGGNGGRGGNIYLGYNAGQGSHGRDSRRRWWRKKRCDCRGHHVPRRMRWGQRRT